MYLVSYSFSGSVKQTIGYSENSEQLQGHFQKLKTDLEQKHNTPFEIHKKGDVYVLSGNEHDGYRVSYFAEPLKNINEILR